MRKSLIVSKIIVEFQLFKIWRLLIPEYVRRCSWFGSWKEIAIQNAWKSATDSLISFMGSYKVRGRDTWPILGSKKEFRIRSIFLNLMSCVCLSILVCVSLIVRENGSNLPPILSLRVAEAGPSHRLSGLLIMFPDCCVMMWIERIEGGVELNEHAKLVVQLHSNPSFEREGRESWLN